MLTGLHFDRFRAFESFTLDGLTRVNLLVGANNAGKTCALEGVQLLLSGGSPQVMWRSSVRRGEVEESESGHRRAVEVCHLFHGHSVTRGSTMALEGHVRHQDESIGVIYEIIPTPSGGDPDQQELQITDQLEEGPSFALRVRDMTGHDIVEKVVPLSASLSWAPAAGSRWSEKNTAVSIIPADDPDPIGPIWDRIVLTPQEDLVTEALRIIEPGIERIAPIVGPVRDRSTFYVKLKGLDSRLPLGSMGDGIRRLLALATHLATSVGGVLLVDEIDRGLHYSVLIKMWKLVVEVARRFDIQVFATTHSVDCIQALAQVAEQQSADLRQDMSLHRIERGAKASTRYTADEIGLAVRHQMELR